MNLPWLEDPKEKVPSVSLSILAVSFLALLIVGGLHVAEKITTTSIFPETFYSALALYFGRRFSFNGKTFTSEKAEEIENKLGEQK